MRFHETSYKKGFWVALLVAVARVYLTLPENQKLQRAIRKHKNTTHLFLLKIGLYIKNPSKVQLKPFYRCKNICSIRGHNEYFF